MATGFDVDKFVNNPTWAELDTCSEDNLLCIAAQFNVILPKQMLKRDLKSLVSNKLVEEGLLPSSSLPCSLVSPDRTNSTDPLKSAVSMGDGRRRGCFKLSV